MGFESIKEQIDVFVFKFALIKIYCNILHIQKKKREELCINTLEYCPHILLDISVSKKDGILHVEYVLMSFIAV